MKIDIAKLQRLEEQARQAWLAVRDLGERRDEARKEAERQRTSLAIQARSGSFARVFAEADEDPERFADGLASIKPTVTFRGDQKTTTGDAASWRRRALEVIEHRDEVRRLQGMYDAAQRHWSELSKCLPALREFAAVHNPPKIAQAKPYDGGPGVNLRGVAQ